MNKVLIVLVGLAVLQGEGLPAQQPASRSTLGAEFRLASNLCKVATDSGSLAEALNKLTRIAVQDPNYPGLKDLQDHCVQEQRRMRAQEDTTFEEAKNAYQRKALDEAKVKFEQLARRNTAHSKEAKDYLYLIANAAPGGAPATTQQDYDNLEQAKRYYLAKEYDKARTILQTLLNRGGDVAAEAKKYLDLIEVRNKSQQLFQQGMQAFSQRRYDEALSIFQKVQQQDPDYPGLATWLSQTVKAMGKTTAPSLGLTARDTGALERARNLFAQEDYAEALKAFRALQSSNPDSPDIENWVQKTEAALQESDKRQRADRLLKDGRALLRRKDYVSAEVQLRRALVLAPNNGEIQQLLQEAAAGAKQARQASAALDRSTVLAPYLENGIREFYAGNFEQSTRWLEQYARENGKHAALAYFYLGAATASRYYLEGGKDASREAQALQFFAQGQRANARFEPPKDWVSPKIMALYQKAAAKP